MIDALAGPMRVLPDELVTEIFKHAIWVDTHSIGHQLRDRENHRQRYITPLTLGAVCHSWRSFVWDTPALWSIIVLLLTYKGYRLKISSLELWFQNSKSFPLDIWFDVNLDFYKARAGPGVHTPDSTRWGYIAPVLRKLVEQSQRWRKFSTLMSPKLMGDLSKAQGNVPLLQAVNLQWIVEEKFPGEHNPYYLGFFEDAPQLNHFTLAGLRDLPVLSRIKLPWSQLISLKANIDAEESWDTVLSKCTNLVKFKLSFLPRSKLLPINSRININLPYLRSFAITNASEVYISAILQRIRCPELKHLHIGSFDYHEVQSFQNFEDFIDRSNCALELLYLKDIDNMSYIVPILEKLPSLKCLVVQARNVHKEDNSTLRLFDALLAKLDLDTNSTTPFLPNLEEVNYAVTPPDIVRPLSEPPLTYVNPRHLLKVLKQRWNPPEGVSKLHTLIMGKVLALDGIRGGDAIAGFRELKRQGMQIKVPTFIVEFSSESL